MRGEIEGKESEEGVRGMGVGVREMGVGVTGMGVGVRGVGVRIRVGGGCSKEGDKNEEEEKGLE